jgi:membrane protease YdiL (CAAX protease family)
MLQLLIAIGMGMIGLLLWRRLSPQLVGAGLHAEDTTSSSGLVGLLGYVVQYLAARLLLVAFPEEKALSRMLALQVAASAVGAGVMLVAMARRPAGVRALGLRGHRGPPAPLAALAAWLAFYPVFLLVASFNAWVQEWAGSGPVLQEPMRLFLGDAAARGSWVVWISVVLLLPAMEELLFRGAIYGAMRRTLHPALAVALSAALFGLAHEPSAALPAAALGAMLATLYELTGSLAAPLAFHALHNGFTLLLATYVPGKLT